MWSSSMCRSMWHCSLRSSQGHCQVSLTSVGGIANANLVACIASDPATSPTQVASLVVAAAHVFPHFSTVSEVVADVDLASGAGIAVAILETLSGNSARKPPPSKWHRC